MPSPRMKSSGASTWPPSSARLLPLLMLLTLAAGCASKPSAQHLEASCPKPAAPAAWAMQPASNSLMLLDRTFSISAPE